MSLLDNLKEFYDNHKIFVIGLMVFIIAFLSFGPLFLDDEVAVDAEITSIPADTVKNHYLCDNKVTILIETFEDYSEIKLKCGIDVGVEESYFEDNSLIIARVNASEEDTSNLLFYREKMTEDLYLKVYLKPLTQNTVFDYSYYSIQVPKTVILTDHIGVKIVEL